MLATVFPRSRPKASTVRSRGVEGDDTPGKTHRNISSAPAPQPGGLLVPTNKIVTLTPSRNENPLHALTVAFFYSLVLWFCAQG